MFTFFFISVLIKFVLWSFEKLTTIKIWLTVASVFWSACYVILFKKLLTISHSLWNFLALLTKHKTVTSGVFLLEGTIFFNWYFDNGEVLVQEWMVISKLNTFLHTSTNLCLLVASRFKQFELYAIIFGGLRKVYI